MATIRVRPDGGRKAVQVETVDLVSCRRSPGVAVARVVYHDGREVRGGKTVLAHEDVLYALRRDLSSERFQEVVGVGGWSHDGWLPPLVVGS